MGYTENRVRTTEDNNAHLSHLINHITSQSHHPAFHHGLDGGGASMQWADVVIQCTITNSGCYMEGSGVCCTGWRQYKMSIWQHK